MRKGRVGVGRGPGVRPRGEVIMGRVRGPVEATLGEQGKVIQGHDRTREGEQRERAGTGERSERRGGCYKEDQR